MTKVFVTPFTKNSAHDVEATFIGRIAAWDSDYRNKAVVGQTALLTINERKGEPSSTYKTAKIIGVLKESDPISQEIIKDWDNHKAGRDILLLKIDEKPVLQGTFHDLFTAGGIIQGSGFRTLKSGVTINRD